MCEKGSGLIKLKSYFLGANKPSQEYADHFAKKPCENQSSSFEE